MGGSPGASEAAAHDRLHDVYVWQRPADLLDYDGGYGI